MSTHANRIASLVGNDDFPGSHNNPGGDAQTSLDPIVQGILARLPHDDRGCDRAYRRLGKALVAEFKPCTAFKSATVDLLAKDLLQLARIQEARERLMAPPAAPKPVAEHAAEYEDAARVVRLYQPVLELCKQGKTPALADRKAIRFARTLSTFVARVAAALADAGTPEDDDDKEELQVLREQCGLILRTRGRLSEPRILQVLRGEREFTAAERRAWITLLSDQINRQNIIMDFRRADWRTLRAVQQSVPVKLVQQLEPLTKLQRYADAVARAAERKVALLRRCR